MEIRTNQSGNEPVSLLGFGSMRLPQNSDDLKDIDTAAVQEMVDYAIANGVNYFDTAYAYHKYVSEKVLGAALSKHPRDSFNLATKMPPWLVKEKSDVGRIFDEQLQKCQVDFFDYYLVHNISNSSIGSVRENQIYEQLLEKKREGKIRHLGFSFHDGPALMETVLKEYSWDFSQIQLNYMDWHFLEANELYRLATEYKVPVVVMEPVRGGALVNLCDSAVQIFKDADPNASIASWAIRFAASLPNVLTVLSGMSNLEQLKDNVKTLSDFHPLTPKEYEVIDRALAEYRKAATVPCTACGYCMDCPFGVDIPKIFAVYNQFGVEKNQIQFELNYDSLGASRHASNCTACDVCKEQCPQSIDIPHWMSEVNALVAKIAAENEGS